ncbi:hypothetical protein Tco_0216494 [Tanacetum coccineum]
MDDDPMWTADRVVAPTPGPAITIPKTANGIRPSIKGKPLVLSSRQSLLLEDKVLLKLDWDKNQKPKISLKKTVAFSDEGSSNSDTDKIMARMDAMTMKMDAQYKEIQSRAKCNHCGGNHSTTYCNDDDTPMSREEEATFMQTFRPKFDRLADKQYARPSGSLPSNTQPKPRGMPNYSKFLKEIVSNKHKLEQISSAFLSDESSAIIQNKVPPELRFPGSFLILCTFGKTFSYITLADLGASINLMPYSLYAKLSLETLKPTKIRKSLYEPPTDLKLKPLPDHQEYAFLEEPSFLPVIISSQLSE